ncbi:MAG: OmpH family outer membrane protein [Bacteroidia bacterium]|nr:OmpH family outer membrane protein [Bacteroidia bacterium]
MTKMYKAIIALNLLLVTGLGIAFFISQGDKRVGYVEINDLYKDFKMTKELESKFTNVSSSRKTFLDSLEIELKAMVNDQQRKDEFERIKRVYMVRKQQFEEDNMAMNQQFNAQIMNQMNQYLVDYGKENGFDFIFGANGNGGLMYANEQAFNVTPNVLTYINSKYAGKVN